MANVKLKSIFTKEDIYTVLQLLKALADGVDENDTNMQAQIDELKQKIATLKPEPEGYSVDNAGNVTINDVLHVNKDGNTEVDGKAYFCGKNALIYHGTVSNTMDSTTVQSTITALMMKGPVITIQGEPEDYSGAGMVVLAAQGNEFMVFLGTPLKVNGNGTKSPATLEDVYNDNWDPYASIASCKLPIMVGDDNTATIGTICAETIIPGGGGISSIGENFIIGNTGVSLANVVEKATGASQGKYQHTVTLHGDGFEFCFTAMSQKNMMVTSYLNLRTVFGGRRIALTGFSAALSARPVYIDLNGKTVETDLIRVYNEAGGGFSDKTLASLGTIIYEDDVSEAK